MTPTTEKALARAHEIEAEVSKLYQEQDDLLTPIVSVAIAVGIDECRRLVTKLPGGFHRSELRTLIKQMERGQ